MTLIILPGIGGSGEAHWQTIWQSEGSQWVRFQPTSWDHPELDDWAQALDEAIRQTDEPAILIAHSLACLLVAHWAARSQLARRVAGAFLVAVPDPDGPRFPLAEAGTFADPPSVPLPFPTLILASSNDPYASFKHAERRAFDWKAGIIDVGALGHVNSASGLGAWLEGRRLLTAFRSGAHRSNG
ncbi:RBBP9/YdeN family alpha/beta hydrolase [Methylorubrum sp. SL192]|uniref:RBBP9/YdeN family alpha/beta hydrolase n=1 Tax=Methylorubrum sp. SL192 TaxID=2995167 RepID=UPI002272BBE3|nr:alpha/beta hydrolase [Methylorubrum sp. SL192]MCY1643334.1 alpha/beta fold hydrolase [Methylorubrum sp. SL192]